MEYLDIYDELGNYIGKEERNKVHTDALWHKTVHAWLYNKKGEVYFQIRKDEGKLYTTASGHLSSGETVKEAFGREIKEEIGLSINYEEAEEIEVVRFTLDRENKDGSFFRDRAFANVYKYDFEGGIDEFDFDLNEVTGLVKVSAKETLDLFNHKIDKIKGYVIKEIDGKNVLLEKEITLNDFLVNKGETHLGKYGKILKSIIEI